MATEYGPDQKKEEPGVLEKSLFLQECEGFIKQDPSQKRTCLSKDWAGP